MKGKVNAAAAIREALRQKRAADSHLRRTLRDCQEVCQHTRVVEAPYSRSEYFGCTPAIRTCIECGLTEYDRWGSEMGGRWDTPTKGPCSMEYAWDRKHVLTTEFVKRVSRKEIKQYQVRT